MPRKQWIAHAISPIDFRWEHLPTVEDVSATLAREDARDAKDNMAHRSAPEASLFIESFQTAMALARKSGWEGDFLGEPHVLWLPAGDGGTFDYAFVWKQENNGTTYVVTPYQLPWLS